MLIFEVTLLDIDFRPGRVLYFGSVFGMLECVSTRKRETVWKVYNHFIKDENLKEMV